MSKRNGAAIEGDIIKSHNSGMFRGWEQRKSEMNAHWQEFLDEAHSPQLAQTNWRMNPLITENRQEFDLEYALEDSAQEKQYEFNFDADPEDKKFSDDLAPGQKDL